MGQRLTAGLGIGSVALGVSGAIPVGVKVASLFMLWTLMGGSLLIVRPGLIATLGLLTIAIGVTWHVVRLPASDSAFG